MLQLQRWKRIYESYVNTEFFNKLDSTTKEKVRDLFDDVDKMSNKEKSEVCHTFSVSNPYLYMAILLKSKLRKELEETLLNYTEPQKTSKGFFGIVGEFKKNRVNIKLDAFTLIIGLKKTTQSSVATVQRVTKTGKRMNQLDYFDRLIPSKKTKELDLFLNEDEIEKFIKNIKEDLS